MENTKLQSNRDCRLGKTNIEERKPKLSLAKTSTLFKKKKKKKRFEQNTGRFKTQLGFPFIVRSQCKKTLKALINKMSKYKLCTLIRQKGIFHHFASQYCSMLVLAFNRRTSLLFIHLFNSGLVHCTALLSRTAILKKRRYHPSVFCIVIFLFFCMFCFFFTLNAFCFLNMLHFFLC